MALAGGSKIVDGAPAHSESAWRPPHVSSVLSNRPRVRTDRQRGYRGTRRLERGCSPPWAEDDLCRKLAGARRYGREPIGALRQVTR